MEKLQILYEQAGNAGRMTVLTGIRRVGKTSLALELTKNHTFIYLFVAKKTEPLLCLEYLEEIKKVFTLSTPTLPVVGEIRNFKDIFALLIEISRAEHFTLIIDEFQEFYYLNPSVYSVYSGRALELFFRQLFADTGQYNRVGNYWEKGNENDIDLVAFNDLKKEMVIAEIKANKSKIRLEGFKEKIKKSTQWVPGLQCPMVGPGPGRCQPLY